MSPPLSSELNGKCDPIVVFADDELLPEGRTAEQRRAHAALYGEGGFSSWERILENAAREHKAQILGNALLELYPLAARAAVSHIEISDWAARVGDLYEVGDSDKVQAITVAAKANAEEATSNPALRSSAGSDRLRPTASNNLSELVIKRASEIAPQPVVWLWPGRMAIGKQTLIAGEPGLGKSQIATALVAAVTTGGLWPHEEGRAPLGNAIILSAEDGIADTIVPRLHAAGANCERAFIVSAVRNNERLRTFNLQADLALMEQTIDRIGDVRLVVVDPISSYMGAIDSHKNTDVRAVLEAVGEMAERRHIAIVGITHFSKGAGLRAINAFMGSVAFIAAARAAFAVMKSSATRPD